MIPLRIEGATRHIGKSQGYSGLSVLDTALPGGTPCMITAWDCTEAERAAIAAGASIYVQILGIDHPPINLWAGDAPSITDAAHPATTTDTGAA